VPLIYEPHGSRGHRSPPAVLQRRLIRSAREESSPRLPWKKTTTPLAPNVIVFLHYQARTSTDLTLLLREDSFAELDPCNDERRHSSYGADDDLPGDLRGRERGVGGRGDSGRGGSPVDGANAGGNPSAGGSPPADAACRGGKAAAPAPAPGGARHRQTRQARGVRARLHRHELSWCCCRAAPHGRPRAPPSGTLRHNLCSFSY